MSELIAPLTLSIPDEQLTDLGERLSRTQWPDAETVPDTSQGPQLAKVRALHDYWLHTYDWRRCEKALNGFGQSRTTIDGQRARCRRPLRSRGAAETLHR